MGLFPLTATGDGEKSVLQTSSKPKLKMWFPCVWILMQQIHQGHKLGKSTEPEDPETCLSCGLSFPKDSSRGSSICTQPVSMPGRDRGTVSEELHIPSCPASLFTFSLINSMSECLLSLNHVSKAVDKQRLSSVCWAFPVWQDRVRDTKCACSCDCQQYLHLSMRELNHEESEGCPRSYTKWKKEPWLWRWFEDKERNRTNTSKQFGQTHEVGKARCHQNLAPKQTSTSVLVNCRFGFRNGSQTSQHADASKIWKLNLFYKALRSLKKYKINESSFEFNIFTLKQLVCRRWGADTCRFPEIHCANLCWGTCRLWALVSPSLK